jgi:hypothetical protein
MGRGPEQESTPKICLTEQDSKEVLEDQLIELWRRNAGRDTEEDT